MEAYRFMHVMYEGVSECELIFLKVVMKTAGEKKEEGVDPTEYADSQDGGLENMGGGRRRTETSEPVLRRDGCGS